MSDILTVTLNPAVDISTSVASVVPEDKLRCAIPVIEPGGGGTNVARAIAHLGGKARAFVAVAGYRGEEFISLLRDDGVEPVAFRTDGETRQSLAVIDREDGLQYRFVMPGPNWDPDRAYRAIEAIVKETAPGGLVVLSGSQPPGVPAHFPTQLAALVSEKGARLILDTSGPPLRALLKGGQACHHVLRLDKAESELVAGHALDGIHATADFAHELVRRGVAETVILALGSEGSVLAQDGHRWHAATPLVKVKSKVGAGDSFVGAFTLAISRDESYPEALRYGVAAASAAVMSDASTLCLPKDVDYLYERCALNPI